MALTKNIDTLLAEVMAEVGYVQKDGKNTAQGYKYASAEAVLRKVNSSLSSRGISISSEAETSYFEVTHYTEETKFGLKHKFRSDAVVDLSLTFHCGGESRTVTGIGQSTDLGDKAVMKANTAAIKYCLTNSFLIGWGDDPEADEKVDREVKGDTAKPPRASKGTRKAANKAKAKPAADKKAMKKADLPQESGELPGSPGYVPDPDDW